MFGSDPHPISGRACRAYVLQYSCVTRLDTRGQIEHGILDTGNGKPRGRDLRLDSRKLTSENLIVYTGGSLPRRDGLFQADTPPVILNEGDVTGPAGRNVTGETIELDRISRAFSSTDDGGKLGVKIGRAGNRKRSPPGSSKTGDNIGIAGTFVTSNITLRGGGNNSIPRFDIVKADVIGTAVKGGKKEQKAAEDADDKQFIFRFSSHHQTFRKGDFVSRGWTA